MYFRALIIGIMTVELAVTSKKKKYKTVLKARFFNLRSTTYQLNIQEVGMSTNISIDSYYRKLLLETVLLPDRDPNSIRFFTRLETFLGSLSNVFDTLSKYSKTDKELAIKRASAWAKTAKFAEEKVNPSASRYFVSIIYAVRVLRKSFVDREQVKEYLDLRIQSPVYEEGCIEKCLQHASIAESMTKVSGNKRKLDELNELVQKRRKVRVLFIYLFLLQILTNQQLTGHLTVSPPESQEEEDSVAPVAVPQATVDSIATNRTPRKVLPPVRFEPAEHPEDDGDDDDSEESDSSSSESESESKSEQNNQTPVSKRRENKDTINGLKKQLNEGWFKL